MDFYFRLAILPCTEEEWNEAGERGVCVGHIETDDELVATWPDEKLPIVVHAEAGNLAPAMFEEGAKHPLAYVAAMADHVVAEIRAWQR